MFEEVRSAVAALELVARELDPERFDGPRAAELFEAFGRGERVCAAAKALLARRVDETKVWRDGGYRSAAHWVAEATGETVGAAARVLDTARALESLPETDAVNVTAWPATSSSLSGAEEVIPTWIPGTLPSAKRVALLMVYTVPSGPMMVGT